MEALDEPTRAVRESTAATARRLRGEADAYDGRRLAERGEPPTDFAVAGELPGEDEVMIDSALYHAAAERTPRARALVRRERLVLGGWSSRRWVLRRRLVRSSRADAGGPTRL
jgi:hypothetical protein